MGLSEIDRNLLERCLQQKSRAWEDFVDRFMGLVLHVVNHTAESRHIPLTLEDRDDLCAEVFLAIVKNDFSLLRNFRGQSSLATYLTVVARRVVVHEMLARKTSGLLASGGSTSIVVDSSTSVEQRVSDEEEVNRLLSNLQGSEADVVRMYHLEGKTYHEISEALGIPENSIGPILSRAREKMRQTGTNPVV